MKDKEQENLFGDSFSINDCDREWKDMPEFVHTKNEPYRVLKIKFKNQEDLDKFEKLINQKISSYNVYWYPKQNLKTYFNDEVYVDEDEDES